MPPLAIIPGDPVRVSRIAEKMQNPALLASHREFTTYRAELDGKSVVIWATGVFGAKYRDNGIGIAFFEGALATKIAALVIGTKKSKFLSVQPQTQS